MSNMQLDTSYHPSTTDMAKGLEHCSTTNKVSVASNKGVQKTWRSGTYQLESLLVLATVQARQRRNNRLRRGVLWVGVRAGLTFRT